MKTYKPNDKEVKEINDFIYDEIQRTINLGSPISSPVFEKKLSLPFECVVCNALITTNPLSINLGRVYGITETEVEDITINITHLQNPKLYER